MKPMPRSAMQVSPQRAAIRAEQGSQGLKKFDQANYQNRQATMQQAQQGMGQLSRDQMLQEIYRQNENSMQTAIQPYPGMPANNVGSLGSGIAAGLGSGIVANRGGQTDSRQLSPAEQARARAEAIMRGDSVTMDYNQERDTLVQQYLQELRAPDPGGASKNSDNGQVYAGGNPNFDERGQSNNLIRYNNPNFPQGPDRMGMPQAYPDRIADPMRPQGDRGPLTRVSPGVYRNTQGQLTGPGGRVMPNQPNRNPAQGYATDMYNNMVQQPGYPNGKGPARDVYSPMGSGGYDLNQAQNPIYGSIGSGYNLPQNTNVMPGYAGPRPSYSPGQWLNRGR